MPAAAAGPVVRARRTGLLALAATIAATLGAAPGQASAQGNGALARHEPGAGTPLAPAKAVQAPKPTALAPPASLMPRSLFNQPVSSWTLDPQSSTIVSSLVSDYREAYGNVGVNYDMPIYDVPAGTPNAVISVAPGCNNFLAGTGNRVPVPSFVSEPQSSDSPVVLYSPSLNKEWEFWRFGQVSAHQYEACWGGRATLSTSDGVFRYPYGESATGISYLATTVTENDIKSGAINHAIALVVPQCNSSVAPADRTDCGSVPGQPAEGQRFRFPSNLAVPSGLPPFARMVFRAIQNYGLVVVDKGGAVQITAEQTSDWAAQGHKGTDPITAASWGWPQYRVINSLPWSQLEAVDTPGGGNGN